MILTEAELLQMLEVQAKATPGPWDSLLSDDFSPICGYGELSGPPIRFPKDDSPVWRRKEDTDFCAAARTDWPRLTAWALEARRIIHEMLQAYPWRGSDLADEARRLLGEG